MTAARKTIPTAEDIARVAYEMAESWRRKKLVAPTNGSESLMWLIWKEHARNAITAWEAMKSERP